MKYYTLLNLKKEPFSNSPDPDFLFLAKQHRECLHQLKLSISLRRGLNVVVGPVGTGKTTLCRQLIKDLGSSKEEVSYKVHLFLESDFVSALEFLRVLCASLGFGPIDDDVSEWQLKERIKHYLVDTGLSEETVITFIFDEGQKLPTYCLEIIRELLNFETNSFKLIQIVVFAQEEFLETLRGMPSLSDRVCNLFRLRRLGFCDTRAMIRHRLKEASGDTKEPPPPSLFSLLDIVLIHCITRGYPRKIIMLCSKVLISLLIRNKKKATPAIVLESASKLPFGKAFVTGVGKTAAVCLSCVALFIGYAISESDIIRKKSFQSGYGYSPGPVSVISGDTSGNNSKDDKITATGASPPAKPAHDAVVQNLAAIMSLAEAPGNGDGKTLPGKYPQSSERLLAGTDFEGLRLAELQLMRNEIYARHNYIFTTEEMSRQFLDKPWYTPREKDVTGLLSAIERANITLIRRQEMKLAVAPGK